MPVNFRKSVTLIELLIAMSLLAVMILGINSIDIFSRFHFFSTDRQAKVQNDVSFCLEHMTKNLASAIGNELLSAQNPTVFISPNSTNTAILSVFADGNGNGIRDAAGGINDDRWIGYTFNSSTNILSYCNWCADSTCSACSGTRDTLASSISAFSASKNFNNGPYIHVSLTSCWQPAATTASCGSFDNPSVTMETSLALPSVANN